MIDDGRDAPAATVVRVSRALPPESRFYDFAGSRLGAAVGWRATVVGPARIQCTAILSANKTVSMGLL